MPGKLLETPLNSGALGLLASAYTNSDDDEDEFENKMDIVVNTKENNSKGHNNEGSACQDLLIGNVTISKVHNQPSEIEILLEECILLILESEIQSGTKNRSDIVTLEQDKEQMSSALVPFKPNGCIVTQELKEAKHNLDDPDISIVGYKFKGKPFSDARIKQEPKSDSSSSDSESDSESSEEDSDLSDGGIKKLNKRQPPRVKGELLLSDLPPIEDLHISVPHEQCEAIGVVKSVVDSLVVVESYPGSAALNLDTVLFLDTGDRTLGHIFDVFGPVKQPHYCVRFNSKDHISSRGVEIGMLVYCAPETEYTTYVFLAQLRKFRGTDASWQDDIEPPPEELEFSDDEMERGFKNKNGKRRGGGRGGRRDFNLDANPDKQSQSEATSSSPGFHGRGRKRSAHNTVVPYGTDGLNSQNSFVPRSPFVPPYVSGFYPPSMMFRGNWRGHFGPGYGRGFGPPQPRPHYFPYPPVYNPYFFPGQNAYPLSHQTPFGYYPPPPPPPPPPPIPFHGFSQHAFPNQQNPSFEPPKQ